MASKLPNNNIFLFTTTITQAIERSMIIVSWNINSVRLRLPLIKTFLSTNNIDILCLQETKVEDDKFPLKQLHDIGFAHIAFRGEKSYNGVAILSKIPFEKLSGQQFGGNAQSRYIGVKLHNDVEIHNFYVPAGGDVANPEQNPKFAHKLQFLDDIISWSRKRSEHVPAIMVGDFNIAPLEHDVWSSKQLREVVSHTDIERSKMNELQASSSWVDSHRHFIPADKKLYSWWSYRARDWEKSDRGRRLDHIWVSQPLKQKLISASILKSARGWEKPSDHAPVITELDI